ncbi:transposase [Methylobacterium sp. WL7]|nr:transposase [Methylobacterium sp. WL7]
MTRAGIELVRSERRRRWTRAEKERLVAASFEPGVSASDVVRKAGLHVSQLFRWRKLLCERVVPRPPAQTRLAGHAADVEKELFDQWRDAREYPA